MKTNNTSANVNTPNINIDAELVIILNNAETNDKKLAGVKASLLKKIEEHPDLEEPIMGIIEMLGL